MPKYKNITASIFVDNKFRDAAKVEFDQSGAAITVEIENTKLLLLPNTGGLGTLLYTIGGVLVIVSPVILLLYKKRRRRLEDKFFP